jgi:hypothetical protein
MTGSTLKSQHLDYINSATRKRTNNFYLFFQYQAGGICLPAETLIFSDKSSVILRFTLYWLMERR